MKKRRVVPNLYRALFDISLMRDEVTGLRAELADADTARLLSRLDSVERVALRLIEAVETRAKVAAH